VAEGSPFEARGDFIEGRFTLPAPPCGEIPLEDPGDLNALQGTFPFASASVEHAVESARSAFPAWRDARAEERADCLRRLADLIRANAERLAKIIAVEAGKPLWEARTEVSAMVNKVKITLDEGLTLIREREVELAPGQVGRWRAHARGALAVLGPFNFPGHLLHGQVVPALATGNSVVIKPSERTPAVGQLYKLAMHPDVQGVLFTGSYAVGRQILEASLDQPWKLVALEMGGKNGVLVCEDADLDAVAAGLIDRLTQILKQIRVGYPLDDDVFMGPLISADARKHHARVLELAREEGAEVLVQGGPVDGPRAGHYVRPSLHRVPALSPESPYQRKEHFVPDLFMLEVDSFEEGSAALNATDYGLVGSVFTRDRERFERAYRESRLGLLHWNASTVGATSRLPFGGVGRSGNDRPAGVLSAVYCTYPVSSLEVEQPGETPRVPGFPGTR
jgi:succinylglutamic semialdehyde dehydrogenase